MTISLGLLIAHCLGDFFLQTGNQALNKSKSNWALTKHVMSYSLCFLPWGIKFALITFILHWMTDWYTSRQSSRYWYIGMIERPAYDIDPVGDRRINHYGAYPYFAYFDQTKRPIFWRWIGFDQLLHAMMLAGTAWWLGV